MQTHVSKECVDRWPIGDESFRECFSECYENLFIFLPSFAVVKTRFEIHSLWNEDVVKSTPQLIRWREIKKDASFHAIAEINKALLPGLDRDQALFNKLKTYTDKRGIVIPGEGIGEGILDPFLIAKIMKVLRRHGHDVVTLSAHGYKEDYRLNRDLEAKDIGLIDNLYYPTLLYTRDWTVLCKSVSDYYCGIIGTTHLEALRAIVSEVGIEGFYAENQGMDWAVSDKNIV